VTEITLASCIIRDPQGGILLIHRKKGWVQWEAPGGKVDAHEDPARAAARETEEEIGVQIRIVRFIGESHFETATRSMRCLWFLAAMMEGAPSCREEEYDDIRSFSLSEMRQRWEEISPITQGCVALLEASEDQGLRIQPE